MDFINDKKNKINEKINKEKISDGINKIKNLAGRGMDAINKRHNAEADVADDLIECPSCKGMVSRREAKANLYVCPKCNGYFRVRTKNRFRMVIDEGSFEEWCTEIDETDPLSFPGYHDKLESVREKTGLSEGVTVGRAKIGGNDCVIGVCDSRFLMGSMGSVYGERITRAVEKATQLKLPVILFCCSGGARMQEGIVSLMQMAKTSAALKAHSDAGLFYISVLTDPTTGGVTASFAMLGDVILAEPGALIGFAGPRVIEQTIGEKLPAGFQRSEFQLEHGFVDAIVTRHKLKSTLAFLLKTCKNDTLDRDRSVFRTGFDHIPDKYLPSEILKERMATGMPKSAWDKVREARSIDRPTCTTLINNILGDFYELHGDRQCKDDKAVVAGVGTLAGQTVFAVGIEKGNDIKECQVHNFGMAGPEGYRKALRVMKLAEKLNKPIICFVNTSGAYPGKEAEERGQGEAIARNLYEMSALKVPVLSIFFGEGGSGGALALGVANEVWMLENATYSVLSPEGFASILWKDSTRAQEASDVMKITAQELKKLGIIEEIIPEYGGADTQTAMAISMYIRDGLIDFVQAFDNKKGVDIAEQRYDRFRGF